MRLCHKKADRKSMECDDGILSTFGSSSEVVNAFESGFGLKHVLSHWFDYTLPLHLQGIFNLILYVQCIFLFLSCKMHTNTCFYKNKLIHIL